MLNFRYFPSKNVTKKGCMSGPDGGVTHIDIDDICEVRVGHSTDNFNRIVANTVFEDCPRVEGVDAPRDQCFSLIFKVRATDLLKYLMTSMVVYSRIKAWRPLT